MKTVVAILITLILSGCGANLRNTADFRDVIDKDIYLSADGVHSIEADDDEILYEFKYFVGPDLKIYTPREGRPRSPSLDFRKKLYSENL